MPVLNTNLTSISKYVIRFIEEHIKAPVTLVGNSMGGHVGLITALARPDLVKHLVLTGSSGLYERTFGDSFPRKVIKLISKENRRSILQPRSGNG